MYLTLTPAYGRDYKSQKAVIADWDADKDFVIAGIGRDSGRYINRTDALNSGLQSVNIRYKQLTMIAVVKVVRKSSPVSFGMAPIDLATKGSD